MSLSDGKGPQGRRIGASMFVPAPPEELYATVLDVKSFPRWAFGVKKVEILSQPDHPGPGMVSKWEGSLLGIRRAVVSVLEFAEAPHYLRWSYISLLWGWGECYIGSQGEGALIEFSTEIHINESHLDRLLDTPLARNVMCHYLRHSLHRLGEVSLPDGADGRGIRIGPLKGVEE